MNEKYNLVCLKLICSSGCIATMTTGNNLWNFMGTTTVMRYYITVMHAVT